MPRRRTTLGLVILTLLILGWVLRDARTPMQHDPETRIRQLLRDGRYEQAVTEARALVTHLETGEVDSARLATALDLALESFWRFGQSREPAAYDFAQRSLLIRERLYGPDGGPVVESLIQLGQVLSELDQREEAIRTLERALRIARAQLGPLDPRTAMVLKGLGFGHWYTGEYDRAADYHEQALRILRKSPDANPLEEASSLNGLAIIDFYIRSDNKTARDRYERILEIRLEHLGPDHPLLAGTYNNLALVLQHIGDDDSARPMLERAIELRSKVDPNLPLLASSLNNLAILCEKAGDMEAARAHYARALRISRKAGGEQSNEVAHLLHNLGWLHYVEADYDGARSYYAKARATFEALDSAEHTSVANVLLDEALLTYQMGYADSAVSLYRRCLAIQERILGPEHPDVAISLGYMAYALADAGNRMAGLDAALRAETIGRDHMRLTARTLAEREALLYSGVRAKGLDLALHLAATEEVADLATPLAWDALIQSRALVLDEMATRTRNVSESNDPEVFRLASALGNSRNELAQLAVRGAEGESPSRYHDALADARQKKETLERQYASQSASFRDQWVRSRMGFDEVQRNLPDGSALVAYAIYELPRRWERRGEASASHGSEAQINTPFGARSPDARVSHLVAFVLVSNAAPRAVALGRMDDIDPVIAAWAQEAAVGLVVVGRTTEDAEAAYRARAVALRQRVWDPLVPALAGAKAIFVVPDGSLHRLNLAALPNDSNGYLIENDLQFHYLAAERDVVPRIAPESEGIGLLAFGGVDFDDGRLMASADPGTADQLYRSPRYRGAQECADFDQLEFPSLPGTEREVRAINDIWQKHVFGEVTQPNVADKTDATRDVIVTGADATEGRFKLEASGKRVLHLATHGFFLGGTCSDGGPSARGRKSPTSSARARHAPRPVTSPLLLAGLVMAGANRRDSRQPGQEDGILTGEEIASLDLHGVELAVLSACDTGVGEALTGEGVLGLRRAFQVAGARSLIMSLWSVSDEPTREWMQAFYRARFEERMGTADATYHASRRMLQQHRADAESTHPFYWASFVSAGDWQ